MWLPRRLHAPRAPQRRSAWRQKFFAFSVSALLFVSWPLSSYSQEFAPGDPVGFIDIQLNNEQLVPGDLLDLDYRTKPGTLTGPVDLYFAVFPPGSSALLFLQPDGTLRDEAKPFRTGVTIKDETTRLYHLYVVDLPFGEYTCFMAFLHHNASLGNVGAFASYIAVARLTIAPLSVAQQAVLAQRGHPDLLTVLWNDTQIEKREAWYYYSTSPTQYDFVNGQLTAQKALSGTAGGVPPKIDPNLLTPQTTLAQLTAALGAPTQSGPFVEGTTDYQAATFAVGLDVVFFKGRFTSGRSYVP